MIEDGAPTGPDDSERGRPVRQPRLLEWIRISRFQTARVWSIERSGFVGPQVVSFHCPTCPEPEDSRLVDVQVEARRPARHGHSDEEAGLVKERLLLRVTREQVEQIRDSFGRRDNGALLADICRAPGDLHGVERGLGDSPRLHGAHEGEK